MKGKLVLTAGIASLLLAVPTIASAESFEKENELVAEMEEFVVSGWKWTSDHWSFHKEDGQLATDWLFIDDKWYYFNSDGAMQTGTQIIQDETYYFDSVNGQMITESQTATVNQEIELESRAIQSGWVYEGNVYYYYAKGKKQTGWQYINGNWFYLASNGAMQVDWVSVGGAWYYLNSYGVMQTGWQNVRGNWFYLASNGAMQVDWIAVGGAWYYLNSYGVMQTGWQSIRGSWYYLAEHGAMQTSWRYINSNWYYFNASGVMQTDWIKLGDKWYYLNASGAMLTGKQTINNKVYIFDNSGVWLEGRVITYVNYNQTLSGMLTKQLSLNPPPQTDRTGARSSAVQVESLRLDGVNHEGIVTGPTNHIYEDIEETHDIQPYNSAWRNATRAEVTPFINPKTYAEGSTEFNQFLVLSKSAGTNVNELNTHVLKGKGILAGRGKSFHDASTAHKINEVYLIAHAFLESGNGTSKLATGVKVGLNSAGQAELLNGQNANRLRNVETVYNMYGIGALDNCALDCGAKRAYVEKWNTPEKAIVGGAKFVSESYINHPTHKQDTLYKMRWNPGNPGVHQYASDMEWAIKQARIQTKIMNQVYNSLDTYTLYYEVPVYK